MQYYIYSIIVELDEYSNYHKQLILQRTWIISDAEVMLPISYYEGTLRKLREEACQTTRFI